MKPRIRIALLVTALVTSNFATGQVPGTAGFSMLDHQQGYTTAFSAKSMKQPLRKRSGAWEEGAKVITLGYGFPNLTKTLFKIYEVYNDFEVSGIGPIHAKFDYGLNDNIGLGASIRFSNAKVQWTDTYSDTVTYTSGFKGSVFAVLFRFNYHFATGDKIDPYVGAGLGYVGRTFSYFSDDPNSIDLSISNPIPIGMESTIGIRFLFTDNFGAYAEVGWGGSVAQAGIALKF
jgi:opacity protein-like surface antigen